MKLSKVFFSINRTMKTTMRLVEKEISIEAPWGKIAALSWGDPSNPPVVLCHGKVDVCSGFRPLVSMLPTCFYYVSVDLPGNGRSDHFAKGTRFTVADLVPTITRVQEHFKWEKFAYIGHSLGVVIGKYFDFAYPDTITRMVELDPVPAYETWHTKSFGNWYHTLYGDFYSQDKYAKYNATVDTAPKYTYEKALTLMMNTRALTREASAHILERAMEPVGDGFYRFTFDQRMKDVPRLPFSAEHIQKLYTSTTIPIFTIIAKSLVDMGFYSSVPFIQDESAWPNKNYKFRIVEGGHDVHIATPECMSDDISKFLLDDIKAKL